MDKRQKEIISNIKKAYASDVDGFIDLKTNDAIAEYGIQEKDFSSRDFTLELAKYVPIIYKHFDFKLFSRDYARELVDKVRLSAVDKVERGVYVSIEQINEDLKVAQDIIKEKVALRAGYTQEKKDLKAKYDDLDKRIK